MSDSPFEFAANATLIFKVSSDGTEVNEFGNIISIKKDLTIRALLKGKKRSSGIDVNGYKNRDGADVTDIEMEGYLVEPLEYPQEITNGMIAQAEIILNSNQVSKGTFVIHKKPENPFLLSAQIKGFTRIEGNFRI